MKTKKQIRTKLARLKRKMDKLIRFADYPFGARKVFEAEVEIRLLGWILRKK